MTNRFIAASKNSGRDDVISWKERASWPRAFSQKKNRRKIGVTEREERGGGV